MSSRKVFALAAVVILGAMLLAACGGGGSTSGGGGGGTTLTVNGGDDLKFTPNTLTVKAGDKVTVNLVNNGSVAHTFVIPDLNVKADMPAGKTNTVTFTAPTKAGTYQIICDVPGHKEAGMVAQLIVQ